MSDAWKKMLTCLGMFLFSVGADCAFCWYYTADGGWGWLLAACYGAVIVKDNLKDLLESLKPSNFNKPTDNPEKAD